MIKRIQLVRCGADHALADLVREGRAAAAGTAAAPPPARPVRVAWCTPLEEPGPGEPPCEGIVLEWFTDRDHLERHERWRAGVDGAGVDRRWSETGAGRPGPVVVAEERVLRGAQWLAARRRRGGDVLKHMALARRAPGLTPAGFSRRWLEHAGRAPGDGSPPLPVAIRGRAYVQNHPVPRTRGEWAWDAINEVYFDDPADLRRRVEWFAANLADPTVGGLVGEARFLGVREVAITPEDRGAGRGRSEPASPAGSG